MHVTRTHTSTYLLWYGLRAEIGIILVEEPGDEAGEDFLGENFDGEALAGENLEGEKFEVEAFMGEVFLGENFEGEAFMGEAIMDLPPPPRGGEDAVEKH